MGEHKRIVQPVYAPRISFYFNPFTGVLFRKYVPQIWLSVPYLWLARSQD